MKFPFTILLLEGRLTLLDAILTPVPLAEMTFRSPAVMPPMVLLAELLILMPRAAKLVITNPLTVLPPPPVEMSSPFAFPAPVPSRVMLPAPSIVTGSVMDGRPDPGEMVPETLKPIVSVPLPAAQSPLVLSASLLALIMASRRVQSVSPPVVLSAVVSTVIVTAYTGGGEIPSEITNTAKSASTVSARGNVPYLRLIACMTDHAFPLRTVRIP